MSELQHGLHPLMTVRSFKISVCSSAFWDRLGRHAQSVRSFSGGELLVLDVYTVFFPFAYTNRSMHKCALLISSVLP